MDLDTITVDDFKSQFPRDFAYLPVYSVTELYNAGDRVYYDTTELFYDALVDGVTGIAPNTGSPNWSTAVDDDIDNYVQDSDISRAFVEAQMNFNQSLFGSDTQITLAYLYLTAHYLVKDLQTALAGIESRGDFLVNSRSVGSVSESYQLPASIYDNPIYSYLASTGYGRKYLSFLIPRSVGNIVSVGGATRP